MLANQVIKDNSTSIISLHGFVELARPFGIQEKMACGTQGRGKTGVPVLTGVQGPLHITGNGGGGHPGLSLGRQEGVRHTAPQP